MLFRSNFFSFFCENVPLHRNMIHWGEFLKNPCNCPPLHRWRRHQNLKGRDFVVLDEASFSNLLFHVASPFHQRAPAPDGSFIDSRFSQHGSSASCLHVGYLCGFPVQDYGVHLVDGRLLILHKVDWPVVVLNLP